MKWNLLGAKRSIEVKKARSLSESELNNALAMATDDNVLWRAVHQLIDVAEENAIDNAAANMDPPGILAGYVGGASHLRMLREELFNRRTTGLEQIQQASAATRR